jgi:ketosteroid isomerase-like protein
MTMTAKEAIENFWRVQDAHDYTRLVDLFADDATLVDPIYGQFDGKEAIRGYMQKMVDVMGDIKMHFEIVEIAGGDETAWAQWESVTDAGRNAGCTLYKVRDGKLTYYKDYIAVPTQEPQ